MSRIKLNLQGQRFGKLAVIKETDPYVCVSMGAKERQWECKCDCGNIVKVRQANLRIGKTRSCGCLKRVPRKCR